MVKDISKNRRGNVAVIEEIYSHIPAFSDVFTEESFYTFVVCFVLSTFVVVFILSRFITLKPVE